MSLLWLGDPKSFDAALVGGKAANLSRLARMYHRVPDGFCIPTTVMEQAHPHELRDEIAQAIEDERRANQELLDGSSESDCGSISFPTAPRQPPDTRDPYFPPDTPSSPDDDDPPPF